MPESSEDRVPGQTGRETLAERARRMADRVGNIVDDIVSSYVSNDSIKRQQKLRQIRNEVLVDMTPVVGWQERHQPQAAELTKGRLVGVFDDAEACVAEDIPEYAGGHRLSKPVESPSAGAKQALALLVFAKLTADSIRAIADEIEAKPDKQQSVDDTHWQAQFDGIAKKLNELGDAASAVGIDKSKDATKGADKGTSKIDAATQAQSVKRPPENAFKVWRLRDLEGIKTQTELAKMMTQNGIPATQGQVSRWLKDVESYLAAGNILPTLPSLISQPRSIDPATLDMGKRQDSRTPRQRERRNSDSD
jgi:hypothetical protein